MATRKVIAVFGLRRSLLLCPERTKRLQVLEVGTIADPVALESHNHSSGQVSLIVPDMPNVSLWKKHYY